MFKLVSNGYYFEYDEGGFVGVYTEQPEEGKKTQCLQRFNCICNTQKEFEIECIYIGQKLMSLD